MALLEIDRIKKDIQWLYYNVRCLLNKSTLESPITATEWSSNHSSATYNQYEIGTFVWYQGNIYECIATNDGLPVTSTLYWKLIGPGHLLQEEQSNWDATGGRSAIRNKPTSTSEFVNDGEDGSSPFATLNDLPMLQDLESVLTAGNTAEDKDVNIKELGLYDDYQSNVVPAGFAKVFAENFKLWFKDKTGINLFYIGYGVIRFFKGIYNYNISTTNLTGNRTATFQDASGVVAYLSDIPVAPQTVFKAHIYDSPTIFSTISLNTTGKTFTIVKVVQGLYTITPSTSFTNTEKVFVTWQNQGSYEVRHRIGVFSGFINLNTINPATGMSEDLINDSAITIEIYP